jgi:hypothetical protein
VLGGRLWMKEYREGAIVTAKGITDQWWCDECSRNIVGFL